MTNNARVDNDQLEKVIGRLGEAAVDPSLWSEILEAICRAAGASGAVLLQSDVRTPDVPRTPSIDEATRLYFESSCHVTDPRTRAFPRMMSGEVVTDQDVLTPEQIRSDPMYNEILRPFGFEWFAGVGFWAGSAFWALTIQRSGREGRFDAVDKQILSRLGPRLTETASLATAVGRAALHSVTNTLQRLEQPALVLSRSGDVLGMNAAADAGFDDDIRVSRGQLFLRDKNARAKLDQTLQAIRWEPDGDALPVTPIVVRRAAKPAVVIRILPIDGAARNVFLGARALLIFSNLLPRAAPNSRLIAEALDLTPAESRLAELLARGLSLDLASSELGISRETARNQLKSAFFKTGTHRQSELISLVHQLR